ncbi:MAG: hypothetical protein V1934_03775 [Methanobacteriota archaeon]
MTATFIDHHSMGHVVKVVVIGNNVSGNTTARDVRDLSPDAEKIIFTSEPYHYYPRPMLVEFIAGSVPEEKLFLNKTSCEILIPRASCR